MRSEARPGVGDLLRLGGRLGAGILGRRDEADAGAQVCRWAREVMEREDAAGLRLGVGHRSVHLVGDAARSQAILAAEPGDRGWTVSPLKADAMGFLAPGALTIADGSAWTRLRAFNERVLGDETLRVLGPDFQERVRRAFQRPLGDLADVRAAMGAAMTDIVLGYDGADHDPAADVSVLFDVVRSPLRRRLLGRLYARRRDRLYALLGRLLDEADPSDPTLLGRARAEAGDLERDEVLQQIPHWMFTFTGSGTDLLARTLALVGARPAIRERVAEEVASSPTGEGESAELPYAEACVLETGRLFPPVTRTFHRGAHEADEPASHVVHWFPLLQRAEALGPSVQHFDPERWLGPELDAAASASNLFLRGPRSCPGADLILLVCRTALARQVGELALTARTPSPLSSDPLPVSFPERAILLTTRGTP